MATFTNRATLSYNGVTTDSNVTVGEILEALSVSKNAVNTTYGPGETVTYVVYLVNNGTAPFTGLTITDNLGGYAAGGGTAYHLSYVEGTLRYFVNGVLQTQPAVTQGPPLTITGVSVPGGGNAALVYEAQLNRFASPTVGGSVSNTAAVTGPGVTTPLSALATVTPRAEALLTVNKSLSPAVVAENGQLTYTFLIQNLGNTAAVATDTTVLTDTFNPIIRNLSATLNGRALTAGTDYTYDETTGAFATTAGTITVPAATYTQNAATGEWSTVPGSAVLTVTGTI